MFIMDNCNFAWNEKNDAQQQQQQQPQLQQQQQHKRANGNEEEKVTLLRMMKMLKNSKATALKNVSLAIRKGELAILCGEVNGKSSILRLY